MFTILLSILTIGLTFKIGTGSFRSRITVTPNIYEDNGLIYLGIHIANLGYSAVMINCIDVVNLEGITIGSLPDIWHNPILIPPNKFHNVNIVLRMSMKEMEFIAFDINDKLEIRLYETKARRKHVFRNGFPVG